MKTILQIHGFFKLPDEFVGSMSDALRLLADWFDDDGVPVRLFEAKTETTKEVYLRFIDLPEERKYAGCIQVQCLDGNKWVNASTS